MCRSGCPTQNHQSWGECARAARFHTAGLSQRDYYKSFDGELRDYESCVSQGMQPEGTTRAKIDKCIRESNEAGRAV